MAWKQKVGEDLILMFSCLAKSGPVYILNKKRKSKCLFVSVGMLPMACLSFWVALGLFGCKHCGISCLRAFGEFQMLSPQVEFWIWNDNGWVASQKVDIWKFYMLKLSFGIPVCIILTSYLEFHWDNNFNAVINSPVRNAFNQTGPF